MIDNPTISVVLSVYNGGEFLTEAIESILNQTYKDFEFIIINDGSTDGSLELIREFEKQDSRIVLITRENKGLIASLNEGIEKSKGKYIARMDADDISLPNRFEVQLEFMEKNLNIGVCGSWIEVFGEGYKAKVVKVAPNDEELRAMLIFTVPVMHPSVMMRKDLLDIYNLRYNEEYQSAEDYKMWLDCAKFIKLANIEKVLLKYRILNTGMTRVAETTQNDKRYEVIGRIFKEALAKMGVENSEEENQFHYILISHERIVKTNVDIEYLDKYLNKLLNANKSSKLYQHRYLKYLLIKKFLVVVYFKVRNKDLSFLQAMFYKKFWLGIWYVMCGKITI